MTQKSNTVTAREIMEIYASFEGAVDGSREEFFGFPSTLAETAAMLTQIRATVAVLGASSADLVLGSASGKKSVVTFYANGGTSTP